MLITSMEDDDPGKVDEIMEELNQYDALTQRLFLERILNLSLIIIILLQVWQNLRFFYRHQEKRLLSF